MKFTENALSKFKKLIFESGDASAGIRFFTTQGCCTPLLQMEITNNHDSADVVVEIDGIDFYISPEADKILSELSIDYNNGSFTSERIKPNY